MPNWQRRNTATQDAGFNNAYYYELHNQLHAFLPANPAIAVSSAASDWSIENSHTFKNCEECEGEVGGGGKDSVGVVVETRGCGRELATVYSFRRRKPKVEWLARERIVVSVIF
jgi:hypothetical protein